MHVMWQKFIAFACSCYHPCYGPAFHLAPGRGLPRLVVLQVLERGSLIRIRYTCYYVDDNGRRINIHAGDAHKCYRRRVLHGIRCIRAVRVRTLALLGNSPSWIDVRSCLDPAEQERLLITRADFAMLSREASPRMIYIFNQEMNKLLSFTASCRGDSITIFRN